MFKKLTLIFLISFFFTSKVNSFTHDKLKEGLEKGVKELEKKIDQDQKNNQTQESNKNSNESQSKVSKISGDYINLPNSKYLTIEAFKRDFNNKILILNRVSNGPNSEDVVLKIDIKQLANGSNFEQAAIDTDVYFIENNKWKKEKLKTFYWEDAYFCDSLQRNNCVTGGMGFQINAFDYIFAIMKTEQKNIGNTVTSKAGYKLIPTFEVQEGDISYNPEQWRLISPNRSNDPEFSVVQLSEDQNIIVKLENEINANVVAKAETQKKNEEAKANQIGFNKKISLQCTYTTNQGINIETYQFEGKNVFWQGIGVELGVPFGDGDTGLFVTREGNSSIIKTKLDTSGMTLNYTIDVQNLQAEYILEGLNFKVLGTCIPL